MFKKLEFNLKNVLLAFLIALIIAVSSSILITYWLSIIGINNSILLGIMRFTNGFFWGYTIPRLMIKSP